MVDKNTEEQTLSEEIYSHQGIPKKFLIVFFFICMFVLLFSIPWNSLLKIPSLAQIVGCPVQHSPIGANFFPPGLHLKTLSLPPGCTQKSTTLTFTDLIISFGGISFSPFGPVINIQTLFDDFPVQAKLAIGLSQINFSSYYEKLSLTKFNVLLTKHIGLPLTLTGNAKFDLRVSLKNQQIDEYKLEILSNDLNLPSQMITFLKVPEIPLKVLNLKAQGKKNNLSIDNLTIGSSSNLLLQSKGNMLVDFQFLPNTQLNMDLELKLSHALNQEFNMISTLLGKNKVSEGNYKMKISGTLASPVF